MKLLEVLGDTMKLRISPSFLEKANCPQYLKFHYVDRIGDKYVRIAAERGSAVHAAIAELMEICREDEIQPNELKLETIQGALEKHVRPEIISEVGLMLEWLRTWADKYEISEQIYGFEEKLAIDENFEECDWDEANFRGILDVIDTDGNHCIVTDWKSQPNILSKTDLDEMEQMTFYCWLAWKLYPNLTRFTARIWYLRYGFYGETERSEEDLIAYEQGLMIKERKILSIENWEPSAGKHCQYCDYIHLCDLATDTSLNSKEVISQEQAVKAAMQITAMDMHVKELKEKLKNYVKSNDAVRIGDGFVYGYHKSGSIKYDPVKLAEVLLEHGYSLADYVNVDAKSMSKLLKNARYEDPALEMAIEGIQREEYSTRFEGKKQKPS